MKFVFDRTWSPPLARAIAALSAADGHEVRHLADAPGFPPSASDAEWIDALAASGDWTIVTIDRLRKGSPEREALRRTGLPVLVFADAWARAPLWDQANALVRLWPKILAFCATARGGAFEIPYASGKLAEIRPLARPGGVR